MSAVVFAIRGVASLLVEASHANADGKLSWVELEGALQRGGLSDAEQFQLLNYVSKAIRERTVFM